MEEMQRRLEEKHGLLVETQGLLELEANVLKAMGMGVAQLRRQGKGAGGGGREGFLQLSSLPSMTAGALPEMSMH